MTKNMGKFCLYVRNFYNFFSLIFTNIFMFAPTQQNNFAFINYLCKGLVVTNTMHYSANNAVANCNDIFSYNINYCIYHYTIF